MAGTATPTAGNTAILKVGSVTVPGTNWRLSIDGKLKDCSNFRDGRLKATTLFDANFSVDVIWDNLQVPNASGGGGLYPGTYATVEFDVGNSKSFQGSFVIATCEPENPGMEDVVVYHVTGELSATLGASGTAVTDLGTKPS